MNKELHFSQEAREKLIKGVNILNKAVASTLGPKGRNVVIESDYGTPHVTKDGVTVAKAVTLADPVENLGAQIIKQAAAKTVAKAGDGTTTATVLAAAMVNEGNRYIQAGVPPIDVVRQLKIAALDAQEVIQEFSESVKGDWNKISQVATISANNDSYLGSIIGEAFRQAGEYGIVGVQESKSGNTYTQGVTGYRYDRGYLSPHFVTNYEKRTAELENVYILFYDKKIRSTQEIVPILEKVVQANGALLVIAEEVEAQALGILVVNKLRSGLALAATKCPAFGDRRMKLLQDMATLTGGQVISESSGRTLQSTKLEDLGRANKIIISANETTILEAGGDPEAISHRIEQVKAELEDASTEYEREKTAERLASLTNGVTVIHVGAPTEVELKEKKDRIDDAINATRAAIDGGIVPGGGLSLAYASRKIPNTSSPGNAVLRRSLEAPIRTILQNAGRDSETLAKVNFKGGKGYNAAEDRIENLKEVGIIDPTLVVTSALEYAVSAASMILLTDTTITNKKSDLPNPALDMDIEPPF